MKKLLLFRRQKEIIYTKNEIKPEEENRSKGEFTKLYHEIQTWSNPAVKRRTHIKTKSKTIDVRKEC